jgi:hypothetical protein
MKALNTSGPSAHRSGRDRTWHGVNSVFAESPTKFWSDFGHFCPTPKNGKLGQKLSRTTQREWRKHRLGRSAGRGGQATRRGYRLPKQAGLPFLGVGQKWLTRGPRRGDRYSSFNPWMMASRSMACPASRKTYRPFRCTCRQATGDVEVASTSAFSLSLASHLASSRDRIAEL